MKKMNVKGVSLQTWVRTGLLLIALISEALVFFGISEKQLDLDSWAKYATYILTVISSFWSWWKNNSFTEPAQQADKEFNL